MIIIGITGTIGAGKGTMVDYIKARYGWSHFSARDFIVAEIERRGLPVNRDTMTEVSNDLRAQHGPGYIIAQLFERAASGDTHTIIESIRTVGEIETLVNKEKDANTFYLFAVDADVRVRYERIHLRGSATDAVSFEKFLFDEHREMESTDPHKQNLAQCIARADYRFENNGDVTTLHEQIDRVMGEITKETAL